MCRRRSKLWPLLCLLVVGAGCDHGRVYHSYLPIGEDGWDRRDTFVFQFPCMPDSTGRIDLSLCLRVCPQPLWRHLAVGVEYHLTSPDTLYRDTFLVALSDSAGFNPKAGSSLLQYSHPMASFEAGRLQGATLRVFHLMRRETLRRVTDVGIRAEQR